MDGYWEETEGKQRWSGPGGREEKETRRDVRTTDAKVPAWAQHLHKPHRFPTGWTKVLKFLHFPGGKRVSLRKICDLFKIAQRRGYAVGPHTQVFHR